MSKTCLQAFFDHFPFSMVKCVWNSLFSLGEGKLPVVVQVAYLKYFLVDGLGFFVFFFCFCFPLLAGQV